MERAADGDPDLGLQTRPSQPILGALPCAASERAPKLLHLAMLGGRSWAFAVRLAGDLAAPVQRDTRILQSEPSPVATTPWPRMASGEELPDARSDLLTK